MLASQLCSNHTHAHTHKVCMKQHFVVLMYGLHFHSRRGAVLCKEGRGHIVGAHAHTQEVGLLHALCAPSLRKEGTVLSSNLVASKKVCLCCSAKPYVIWWKYCLPQSSCFLLKPAVCYLHFLLIALGIALGMSVDSQDVSQHGNRSPAESRNLCVCVGNLTNCEQ